MLAAGTLSLSGGSAFVWSNGSGTEGEHKELTTSQAHYPLVSSKTSVLGCLPARSPLLKRGWGLEKVKLFCENLSFGKKGKWVENGVKKRRF